MSRGEVRHNGLRMPKFIRKKFDTSFNQIKNNEDIEIRVIPHKIMHRKLN